MGLRGNLSLAGSTGKLVGKKNGTHFLFVPLWHHSNGHLEAKWHLQCLQLQFQPHLHPQRCDKFLLDPRPSCFHCLRTLQGITFLKNIFLHKSFTMVSKLLPLESGFSLTFEVEGHWLVSRQVPCETEGGRPETVGGSGGMLPRKIFRT